MGRTAGTEFEKYLVGMVRSALLMRTSSAASRGEPIAPELLPTLFGPMKRGSKLGQGPARTVGLGLNIVSEIVKQYRGSADVREADGTAFVLRLPRGSTRLPSS